MADGATPNYNLILPEVGASADSWGSKTNYNWDSVDTDLHNLSVSLGNYLPLTGGSVGSLAVGGTGISYPGVGFAHTLAFGWDGSYIDAAVDGSYVGQLATVGWANGTFATYSWVNGNFYPAGTTDGRYLYKGGDTCTGNLTVDGNLTTPNQLMGNTIQCTSGIFYVANTNTYYMQRNASNGHWYWVDNGNAIMDLDPSGNLTVPGGMNAGTHIALNTCYFAYGSNPGFRGWCPDSTHASISFNSGNYRIQVEQTTNQFHWVTGSNVSLAYLDTTGTLVLAGSLLQNYPGSDERVKRNVHPYVRGLADLIELEPVSFEYNGLGGTRDDGRTKYGLIAQRARPFIPECVHEMGEPPRVPKLAPDDPDPEPMRLPGQLSLDHEPLIYALINAVKELSARLAALEGVTRA